MSSIQTSQELLKRIISGVLKNKTSLGLTDEQIDTISNIAMTKKIMFRSNNDLGFLADRPDDVMENDLISRLSSTVSTLIDNLDTIDTLVKRAKISIDLLLDRDSKVEIVRSPIFDRVNAYLNYDKIYYQINIVPNENLDLPKYDDPYFLNKCVSVAKALSQYRNSLPDLAVASEKINPYLATLYGGESVKPTSYIDSVRMPLALEPLALDTNWSEKLLSRLVLADKIGVFETAITENFDDSTTKRIMTFAHINVAHTALAAYIVGYLKKTNHVILASLFYDYQDRWIEEGFHFTLNPDLYDRYLSEGHTVDELKDGCLNIFLSKVYDIYWSSSELSSIGYDALLDPSLFDNAVRQKIQVRCYLATFDARCSDIGKCVGDEIMKHFRITDDDLNDTLLTRRLRRYIFENVHNLRCRITGVATRDTIDADKVYATIEKGLRSMISVSVSLATNTDTVGFINSIGSDLNRQDNEALAQATAHYLYDTLVDERFTY